MREIAKALALCDECFNLPFDVYQLPLQLTMCSAIENHLKKTTPSTGRCYVLRSLSILLRQPQKLAFSMSQVQGGWNSMLASVLHNCNVYTVGVSVGFFSSLLGSRVRCWLSPLARFLHALAPPTWGPNMTQHWTNSAWDLTAALIFASWHVLSWESSIRHRPKK